MKTITRGDKPGFPETFVIIIFLSLLIATYVLATQLTAMAQSLNNLNLKKLNPWDPPMN
jgi:hypothetical protein